MYYYKNDLDHARVGVSVSSKLGNSVVRHKIKRQFVSMIDEILNFNLNYDVIIIARKKFLDMSYKENYDSLKKDIEKIFEGRK
jgi:ribonuclease P protein component